MRRTLAAVLSSALLTLALAAGAHAQTGPEAAAKELVAGSRAYQDGRFAEAEQHFRRVLELDPSHKNAPLFIARSIQQQYKPGDASPENVATGERAVAAYRDILERDPQNEDAYKAIVFLYGQMNREDKVLEMLTERANDTSLPDEKRAELFVILASKQWQCSYDVTERRENPRRDTKSGRVSYRMPADAADFARARQCADEGLRLVEQAASLDPKSPSAWSYKVNLLREESKLAEMEGDAERKADYERQYEEASDTQKRLSGEAQRKEREGQKVSAPEPASTPEPPPPLPPPTPTPTPEPKHKFSGGSFAVFNGKAVSKPEPDYPADAEAAGVRGFVAVYVTVDKGGNVVEAEAVSGPPSLREAAVAAARRAKFSPTLLSGRPVAVRGLITYNFAPR